MANNDDNSRRNRDRPEDNPFIAFRRFADSQVSSLLNTVFTLPATIANYSNVHQAREACLFNKADKAQCERLQAIEDEIAGLRHEGRELYRAGDLQQVLKKSEELMRLDRHAEDLRKDIVGQSDQREDQKELVHRVANKKGQEWGWDWSWGFPKPFDDDRDAPNSSTADRRQDQAMAYFSQLEREVKSLFGEDAWDEAVGTTWGVLETNPMLRGLVGEKEWKEVQRMMSGLRPYSPQALELDSQMQQAGVNWRKAYEDLVRAQEEEDRATKREIRSRAIKVYPKRVPWADEEGEDEPSYEYSHDHEDQHDDPPTPKTRQGGVFEGSYGIHPCSHVPDQTAADKRDIAQFLTEQQRENGRYLSMRESAPTSEDWCDPAASQSASDKLDIQKFLAEQEQRNGRYLGLRDSSKISETSETELDAYEQLLEKPKNSEASSAVKKAPTSDRVMPSILSTLTTTERTVAPDGSVTTKVVLKKRFADGREESSETVHTQRGQESDPWEMRRHTDVPRSGNNEEGQKKETKKGGWFWSS